MNGSVALCLGTRKWAIKKPFGINTLCSSYLHINEALAWKLYGQCVS